MEIADMALEIKVIDVLKACFDPEIPTNIYDLGLIYKELTLMTTLMCTE
jgi:metal-sulfur cluster biosynthetic enzyme